MFKWVKKKKILIIDDLCNYNDPKDLTYSYDDIEYAKPWESYYYCRQIIGSVSVGTCEKYILK